MTRFFLDTNILLYAAEEGSEKQRKAIALITAGAVVSIQVLNEFIRVSTRKYKVSLHSALLALAPIKMICEIVPITIETHDLAVSLASKNKIQIYDANIIAAAELSGCDTLYTEDLNNGQRISKLAIVNPFV